MRKAVWNDEKDLILIKSVRGADSLQTGLKTASEEVKLSHFTCKNRWYTSALQRKLKAFDKNGAEAEKMEQLAFEMPEAAEQTPNESPLAAAAKLILSAAAAVEQENQELKSLLEKAARENRKLAEEKEEFKNGYESLLAIIDRARAIQKEEKIAEEAEYAR